jgi:hypothetical protein
VRARKRAERREKYEKWKKARKREREEASAARKKKERERASRARRPRQPRQPKQYKHSWGQQPWATAGPVYSAPLVAAGGRFTTQARHGVPGRGILFAPAAVAYGLSGLG